MSLIKQAATFRGIVSDKAVSLSTGGFPQLVMSLQTTEMYDPDLQEWVDWSEDEENETTAYLILFGGNGEATRSAKQIMKVLGWSGESFQELDELEIGGPIQFRTKENEYQGKISYQVAWIDVHDAEPGSSMKRLDKDELKRLDAKHATGLRKISGGPKPKSVPAAPPKPPKSKSGPPKKEATEKKINAEKAWEICEDRKPEGITNKALEDAWVKVTDAAGTDEQITANNGWGEVCHQVLEAIGVKDSLPF